MEDKAKHEKRKRVMTRSIKLGHCVCDPRKPCPCPLFKEKNVCTCAGERVPLNSPDKPVRLTEHIRSAGCASKIGQKDLHQVLAQLPKVEDPRLVVGMATADDAGVFKLAPGVTIVQTVDVFTPGVDDPYTFGKIAACNSLSDVYAMGGIPVTALSIIGFPIESLPAKAMADIIRGGMDVLKEAGVILLGGHSINDEEVKFGFAVTGLVKDAEVVTNAGARPGDVLILTKPLGTGIISLASQIGRASPESVAAIMASMTSLNNVAAGIMVRHHASACTDVTGFGMIGHLRQMVLESHVTAELWADRMPLFPGVLDYAAQGMFSGANERNSEYSQACTVFDPGINEAMKAVFFDAQTSGGLLMALPHQEAETALRELQGAGLTASAIVGRITDSSEGRIHILKSPGQAVPTLHTMATTPGIIIPREMTMKTEDICCAHDSNPTEKAMSLFASFMGTAMAPGALDVVTKEYLAIALALAVNCVPCAKMHIKKAKAMGIGLAELDEAAAIAVAFGGCRVLMLWNELKKELL
jgi:selenide,water dikinase